MGMYDDIQVSRSYLKDLLTKEQEKLIKIGNKENSYQTKDLENGLLHYKIYRRKLYRNTAPLTLESFNSKNTPKPKWEEEKYTGSVSFYTSFNIEGDRNWFEFNFTFKDGVIDKKELIDYDITLKADIEREEEQFNIIHNYINEHHEKKKKIKLYRKLSQIFLSLYTHYNRKCLVPKSIRKKAFELAGKDYNEDVLFDMND